MNFSRTLAPLALSFGMIAGTAFAEETANDNFSFSCDMPDMSSLSTPDLLDQVYPANVLITARERMVMPFGLAPNSGAPPSGRAPGMGSGSGFIIDPRGYIITNAHVLGGDLEAAENMSFTVTLYDPNALNYQGAILDAELIGIDSQNRIDIAILKINVDEALPCVNLGDSDEVRVGEEAFALGNPLGQTFTFTRGYISHTMRNSPQNPANQFHEYIQTDAAINRGNSGGGLYNMAGEVIGVNVAIISSSGDSAGIGFAIPSNVAAITADKLIRDGEIRRGYLNARVQNVDAAAAAEHGVTEGVGVLITSVAEGGPADIGGLEDNDIVLSINGREVNTTLDLVRRISEISPGDVADLSVLRNGQIIALPVTLGERDAAIDQSSAPVLSPPPDGTPDIDPDADPDATPPADDGIVPPPAIIPPPSAAPQP